MTKEEKLKRLRQLKIEPYPESVKRDAFIGEFRKNFSNQLKRQQLFWLTGRLIAIRTHGRLTFADLKDASGKIQLIFNSTKTKNYNQINLLDLGDFVNVRGLAFLPTSKQPSFLVKEFHLISKTLRNFPKDYYKIRDEELLSRLPYLRTIFYPEQFETFTKRFHIIKLLRQNLWQEGFIEVETPILQTHYGGAFAKPFTTHLDALNQPLYLRIAPELYLKKMIVGGFEKIFEIGKNFRNEGIDREHNPEFTVIELYWAYQNRDGLLDLTQRLLQNLVAKLNRLEHQPGLKRTYQKQIIDFSKKRWPRLRFTDLIKKRTGLDYFKDNLNTFVSYAKKSGIEFQPKVITKGKLLDEIFKKSIRHTLIQPVFLIDHPKDISPLAKIHPKDSRLTARFQLYVGGLELVNGWAELNDPIDQRERFLEQNRLLKKGDIEAHPYDETFIEALEYGMPPTAGLGVGIDRLVALLTDQNSLQDVIYFPFVRESRPGNN